MVLKKQITTLALAAALLSVTACSGHKYHANASDDFVTKVATSDRFEIATSKLALSKSKNPKVVKFAKDMIREHNKSTSELRQSVAASNINMSYIPEKMTEDQKDAYNDLKMLSGRKFDVEYMEEQRDAHSEAVRLFRNYAQRGQNAELREFAQNTLPKLEHHEQMAYSIEP